MKILVTGGCGYIGTELIKTLIKKNFKIISVDKKFLVIICQNTKI